MIRDEAGRISRFERGDVVFGTDPFKEGGDGRPWLLRSNHEGQPFHGEQYIALSLTTRTWLADLLETDDDAWVHGGTPVQSRIVPWAIQSFHHADIDFPQGRLVGGARDDGDRFLRRGLARVDAEQ